MRNREHVRRPLKHLTRKDAPDMPSFDASDVTKVESWLATFDDSQPVIVVTIYNAYDDVTECVETLLSTVSPATPILLLDDASPDMRIQGLLEPLAAQHGFAYLRKRVNRGIVDSANFAFRVTASRDVLILNSDILLPPRWLERLRTAAYSRSNIATATPLTNNGVIYSVPYRNQPIEHFVKGMTLEQIDAAVEAASLYLRPVVPTAITFCTFFRRTALDAVGLYDEVFSPGYGEEVDFSQRATISGFTNIIVDDLFVFHKGSRSFGSSKRKQRIQDAHESIVRQRYPWHAKQVQQIERDRHDPLFEAVDRVRGALLGYRIGIDATCLNNDHVTGTQVYTSELVRALASIPDRTYKLTLVVSDDLTPKSHMGLDKVVDNVLRVSEIERADLPIFDLVHRPFQVNTADDLLRLRRWAARFVVSHLDCIGFSNPNYARTVDEWFAFRDLTRLVFSLADGIAYISQDAADDATHRGLIVPPERSKVVYLGVDHLVGTPPRPPAAYARFADRPYLLMLGTNFRHKNRTFALNLFDTLLKQKGWDGNLVFAGPRVSTGGSNEAEARVKLNSRAMAARVFELGPVTDAEKDWLLAHAALVLYPSVYEGFGIVPFEAAGQGTPTLAARMTSVGEVLGDIPTFFGSFNPVQETETAWAILSDPAAAERQVAAIRERATRFTWKQVALQTEHFYHQLLALPSRSQFISDISALIGRTEYNVLLREHVHMEEEYRRLEREYRTLLEGYTKLETWAQSLNELALAPKHNPVNRVLSRLRP